MILTIVKSNGGQVAYCKCDRCGKEFKRALKQINKHNHFCGRICAGGRGRPETNPNICIICGKPKDDTFYDKSDRLICSKECYSKWWDTWYKQNITWERKGMPRNMGNDVSKVNYTFYRQGRLIAYYNYGV